MAGFVLAVSISRYLFRHERDTFYAIGATDEHMDKASLILGVLSWGTVLILLFPCITIYRRKTRN